MTPLTAPPSASAVLADSDVGKGSPIGLLVVLLLIVAVYFLYRSMNRHLRKVPPEFDPPKERLPDERLPEANRPPEAESTLPPEAESTLPPVAESTLPPVGEPTSNGEHPPEPRPARPDDDTD